MSWLRFLSYVSLSLTVAVNVIILCYAYPAFRRTRDKAFVFLAVACALGIVVTVHDHTVIPQSSTDHDYIIARTFRRFAYFVDEILWCTGLVLLIRSHLNGRGPVVTERTPPSASPDSGPPKSLGDPGAGAEPPLVR